MVFFPWAGDDVRLAWPNERIADKNLYNFFPFDEFSPGTL